MSIAAQNAVKRLQLDPTQKNVLRALADYADDEGYAWPKQKTIASDTCYSRKTVNQALAALEAAGYITSVQQHRKDGKFAHKKYRLMFLDEDHGFPLTEVELERIARRRKRAGKADWSEE